MPATENAPDSKEEEENEADENEKDSIEQSSSSEEDESSLDECDSESRRVVCADDINHAEKAFAELRELLYGERNRQLVRQREEIQSETSALYQQQLKDLDRNRQRRLATADHLQKLKRQSLEDQSECELQSSRQHLESERRSLLDTMRCDVEEKLQRTEEDRSHLELSNDVWNEQRPQKRQRRGDGMTDKRRKVTVTGPVIILQLPELEIIDDWAMLRRAMKMRQSSRASTATKSTSQERSSSHQSANGASSAPHGNGLSATKSPMPASNAVLSNGHYEDGKLFFHDDWYLRGSKIVVKDVAHDHTTPATILSISPSEVALSCANGTSSKIGLSQLQRGRIFFSFQE